MIEPVRRPKHSLVVVAQMLATAAAVGPATVRACSCIPEPTLTEAFRRSAAGGENVTTYATGVTGAKDLAWDANGALFVSGQGAGVGAVYKVGPGGTPVTVLPACTRRGWPRRGRTSEVS